MLSYRQFAELNPFVQWVRQVEGLADARERLDETLRSYVAAIS